MKNIIKTNLEKLTELEKLADQAEHEYIQDSENPEKEKAFDDAYLEECKLYLHVAVQVSSYTGLSVDTAKKWVKTKREELISILEL